MNQVPLSDKQLAELDAHVERYRLEHNTIITVQDYKALRERMRLLEIERDEYACGWEHLDSLLKLLTIKLGANPVDLAVRMSRLQSERDILNRELTVLKDMLIEVRRVYRPSGTEGQQLTAWDSFNAYLRSLPSNPSYEAELPAPLGDTTSGMLQTPASPGDSVPSVHTESEDPGSENLRGK